VKIEFVYPRGNDGSRHHEVLELQALPRIGESFVDDEGMRYGVIDVTHYAPKQVPHAMRLFEATVFLN
jgi:hypothetical protein